MSLSEKLEQAKVAAEKLDQARQNLPDNAPDSDFEIANKAYFNALDIQAQAQQAYNLSISTESQIAAQYEQRQVQLDQLAAHQRLLASDRKTVARAKSQAQLDAEYDEQLQQEQE